MDYLSLKIENHIGIVTMNKPPVNALDIAMYREIIDTFSAINTDDDIWVALLRAEGKQFSTGNDVKEFIAIKPENTMNYGKTVSDAVASVYNCRVPVIAAVNGLALGAGMAIATCCDIIMAAEEAAFGLPEIKVSIVGAACFLSRILPEHIARYMALTGEPISAERMKHFGVVWETVPGDLLYEASMKMAVRLTQLPPLALRGFKDAMNRNEHARLAEKYALELHITKEMTATEDFKEALESFMKKRKPNYQGKAR